MYINKRFIARAYLFGGGLLLLIVAAKCFFWAIVGVVGYRLFDTGLRKHGYPPLSYWMSWVRAQW